MLPDGLEVLWTGRRWEYVGDVLSRLELWR
jgi:hypothetical protein